MADQVEFDFASSQIIALTDHAQASYPKGVLPEWLGALFIVRV
jgi:hypothetical protein